MSITLWFKKKSIPGGAGRTIDVVDLALALKAEFKRFSCFAFLQDIILMPFAFKYL